jgi:hypothetical protein
MGGVRISKEWSLRRTMPALDMMPLERTASLISVLDLVEVLHVISAVSEAELGLTNRWVVRKRRHTNPALIVH